MPAGPKWGRMSREVLRLSGSMTRADYDAAQTLMQFSRSGPTPPNTIADEMEEITSNIMLSYEGTIGVSPEAIQSHIDFAVDQVKAKYDAEDFNTTTEVLIDLYPAATGFLQADGQRPLKIRCVRRPPPTNAEKAKRWPAAADLLRTDVPRPLKIKCVTQPPLTDAEKAKRWPAAAALLTSAKRPLKIVPRRRPTDESSVGSVSDDDTISEISDQRESPFSFASMTEIGTDDWEMADASSPESAPDTPTTPPLSSKRSTRLSDKAKGRGLEEESKFFERTFEDLPM